MRRYVLDASVLVGSFKVSDGMHSRPVVCVHFVSVRVERPNMDFRSCFSA